ncbi:PREDICTED: uncharacterized protein LOC109176831 [Ipomoea nil]|uniref:uncharacterized protein LOC109176831 n=1 Tax=Ipomoea nil TaxID=35883 RepID=UPI000900E5D1|nr:PREDICTED: uncharacterized protein LOC109176831 [Ipomoea nil]
MQTLSEALLNSNHVVPPPPPAGHRDIGRLVSRHRPPTFAGEEDPVVLEEWLRVFDKIFTVVGCPEERRVELAAFYFCQEADLWWVHEGPSFLEKPEYDWPSSLNDAYLSAADLYRVQQLQKGSYELARKRFESGDVGRCTRAKIVMAKCFAISDVEIVVTRSRSVPSKPVRERCHHHRESEEPREQKSVMPPRQRIAVFEDVSEVVKRSRLAESSSASGVVERWIRSGTSTRVSSSAASVPVLRDVREYGEIEVPHPTVGSSQERVLTLNEVRTCDSDVVVGTFLVQSVPATVLFDSGASNSFISPGLVKKLGLSGGAGVKFNVKVASGEEFQRSVSKVKSFLVI